MGSRAFTAVARAVLFVMTDPNDEQTRLLGQAKNNLGRMDLPRLAFRIVEAHVADTEEGPVHTGKLGWTGESTISIRDALDASTQASGDKTATSEAMDSLDDYLHSENGQADSANVKRKGAARGPQHQRIAQGAPEAEGHHHHRRIPAPHVLVPVVSRARGDCYG